MFIRLNNINRSFGGVGTAPVRALRDICLEVAEGELVCIEGPSGAGKTTLLRVLGCLDTPNSGSYFLGDREIQLLSRKAQALLRQQVFGFIFQSESLLDSATALENVKLPGLYMGTGARDRTSRAKQLLGDLGLANRIQCLPSELSGGEQQRVAIARALMNGGRVILADEPTKSLDRKNAEEVILRLQALARNGHTVILASHDVDFASQMDRRVEMRDGRIISDSGPVIDSRHSPGAFFECNEKVRRPLRVAFSPFKAGWSAIRSNLQPKFRLRTSMLLLSVMVSVVLAGTTPMIAKGAFQNVVEEANVMGLDAITVLPFNLTSGKRAALTFDDAKAIEVSVPGVRSVSPEIFRSNITARNGVAIASLRLLAFLDLGSQANRGRYAYRLERGRSLSVLDNENSERVAVICAETRKLLFPAEVDPVGQKILLNGQPFQIKGILKPFNAAIRGSAEEEILGKIDSHANSCVIIPPNTAVASLFGPGNATYLHVFVKDIGKIAETARNVRDFLIRRHGEDGFSMSHKASKIEEAMRIQNRMWLGLGSITTVALLASGLSVAAVMFMSIKAREREIGIRVALGARHGDVFWQFLTEAVILTSLSGLIGILLICILIPMLQEFGITAIMSPWHLSVPPIGALGLGILFGVWPAYRAAKSGLGVAQDVI